MSRASRRLLTLLRRRGGSFLDDASFILSPPMDGETATHPDDHLIYIDVDCVPSNDNVWIWTHKADASHFLLWIFLTSGDIHIYDNTGGGADFRANAGAAAVSAGDYVVLKYTRSTGQVAAYVNGVEAIAATAVTAPAAATTLEVDIRNALDDGCFTTIAGFEQSFSASIPGGPY